ncbi:MAG: DNA repair protein RecO [Candidatus Omnitrophica bacterium]|nr:DNA repair protein RecO [Candidatus Omnitrophota bacterium]
MGIHTAEAIVLRRYPFRETSVTLTCLTDQFGKLKGLVKGLRTQPNRYRSAMEPLTVNRIVFYDTRTSQLHLISQCDLVDPLEAIQRDLDVARLAALCVEVVDAVVPLDEPQPQIYQLLKHTLERLAVGAGPLDTVRIHFVMRLLKLAGFHPQLNECAICSTHVHAAGYWSAREGGLLCPNCLHQDPRAEAASSSTLETLAALSDSAQPLDLDPSALTVLRQRLDEFLRWRLDKPLKTLTT